ncbi:MAG: DNA integrity scanning protein DisA nucleotide-binding domain protein [Planctomycetes bacterium]|nr:DNA integrity scanning protein DisA nucleotide-binding domain protein [Planctomycetota bacterium]
MIPNWQTVVEVILLALVYYGFIRHLQAMRGGGLLAGFIILMATAFFVFGVVLRKLDMPHLSWIAQAALPALGLALLVIFQPELRLVISRLGNVRLVRIIERFFGADAPKQKERVIEAIVNACDFLSRTKTGALIVIQRREGIEGFNSGGTRLDADVSARLLENIFYKGAPLHDGAVLVMGGRIMYAACHLPAPAGENPYLTHDLGTRHRAALGLSEQSDAIVVVVSEETGRISIAEQAQLKLGVDLNRLRAEISEGIVSQLEAAELDKRRERTDSMKSLGDETGSLSKSQIIDLSKEGILDQPLELEK